MVKLERLGLNLPDGSLLLRFALVFLLVMTLGGILNWYVGLNDMWGVLYYAKKMTSSDLHSLYNKFYPIGDALLLRPFGFEHIEFVLYCLNALFSTAVIVIMACFLRDRPSRALLVTVVVYLLLPLNFRYLITPCADAPAAVFVALAALQLYRWDFFRTGERLDYRAFMVGLLLGLASLFRYHAQGVFIGVLIYTVLTLRARAATVVFALLVGFLAATLPQSLINIVAGHMPFESEVKISAYRLIHGFNFLHHPSTLSLSMSDILLEDVGKTALVAFGGFSSIVIYALPAICLGLLSTRPEQVRFARFSSFVILVLSLLAALGGSERAPLIVSVFYIVPTAMLVYTLLDYFRRELAAGAEVVIGLFVAATLAVTMAALSCFMNLSFYNGLEDRRDLSYALAAFMFDHAGVRSVSEIFTDDLSLYFPQRPYYVPRLSGGWGSYGLWGYDQDFPPLPVDTFAVFRRAAYRQGIRYLVLSPASSELAPSFSELYYRGTISEPYVDVPEQIGQVGQYRIFKL